MASTRAPGTPRRSFALTGPSRLLDPLTHAVRPDLADVRLADRVFAPHYAQPTPRTLARQAPLRLQRSGDSEAVAVLDAGEHFELLDVTGGLAWGIAPQSGLVGYLEADALGDPA